MSERIHELAFQLFGKSSVGESDVEQIKTLANQYPYFSAAQFLLLEKIKQDRPEEYAGQLQKAILYYHNPLEFERFIHSERFYTEVFFDRKPIIEEVPVKEMETEIAEEQIATTNPEEKIEEIHIAEEEIINYKEDEFVQEEKNADNQEIASNPFSNEFKKDIELQIAPDIALNEAEPILETFQTNEDPAIKKEPETTNSKPEIDLVFEPYHTVDYFASQGIKLSKEEGAKDKLGKQLKSFTEWLKTMKKIPPVEAVQKPETSSEKQVQYLAEDSVHQADVLTEAMAEVWMKQGNKEKALEVYNKLSLSDPSKSAYFAAKIEHLKSL